MKYSSWSGEMNGCKHEPASSLASDSPPAGDTESATRKPWVYLVGIGAVLFLNVLGDMVGNRLWGDTIVLGSILLIGFVFYQLLTDFHCSVHVKALLFFAVLAMTAGQIMSITEEIPALDAVPVIGDDSSWNSFLDTLGMVVGLVLVLSALVLAVVDLGQARDVLCREVTVRTKAEAALEAHQLHLEDEIRARTADLERAQEELLEQERLIALGEIMSSVSHELRNPLGVIRSSLFSLKRAAERGREIPVGRLLERCDRSITRCDHIIEELHDFSRPRTLEQASLALDTWLREVIAQCAIPDTIEMETDLQSGIEIPLDPERMRLAIRHFIENSIDALECDSVEQKRLRIRSHLNGDGCCRIDIEDTGTGMTPEELSHVADPLFSTRAFGAGLGVPIAQDTVRLHGGAVHYESSAGQGTTVTIELPLATLDSNVCSV
jgi:signal transduction histidine kinase